MKTKRIAIALAVVALAAIWGGELIKRDLPFPRGSAKVLDLKPLELAR